jgi:hypothetical protein
VTSKSITASPPSSGLDRRDLEAAQAASRDVSATP